MAIIFINFGRSGGTIFSQCLGSLPNTVLISEINPLGGCLGGLAENSFDTVHEQAKNWYGILLNYKDYKQSLFELEDICIRSGKKLIIRDWSHVNFRSHKVNNFNPPKKFLALEELQELKPSAFAMVRDSIDMWISFGMPDTETFFTQYKDFIEELIRLKIPIFKYEDFVKNPRRFLKKICNTYQLEYADIVDTCNNYNKITGDVQFGNNSRGRKQNAIKPLPRKNISFLKMDEINRSRVLVKVNEQLGYPSKYYSIKYMIWKFVSKIKTLRHKITPQESFSQSGEDLIIFNILRSLHISNPFYIDIGAHHPFKFNNTALFYGKGNTGINIEPNPDLFRLLIKYRKRDINLNAGVGEESGRAEYYRFSESTLNTFNGAVAEEMVKKWKKNLTGKSKIPVITVADLAAKHIKGRELHLVNVDVEGQELPIIKQFFDLRLFPVIFCIETITYAEDGTGIKKNGVFDLLLSNGYMVYADTYINTIFVRKDKWQRK